MILGHHHTSETKAKISAAQMGNTNGLGHRRTATQRAKMRGNIQALGYRHTEKAKARIGQASRGRHTHHNQETRAKMAESAARRIAEGRLRRKYTQLQLNLANFLLDVGLNVTLEVQFGRACVDIYLPDHHLAVEADGEYWHGLVERERPGYYARRDAELLKCFNLPVTRFTGAEIKELVL